MSVLKVDMSHSTPGERVKNIRNMLKLTMAELASMDGSISISSLTKYESGHLAVSQRFADLLVMFASSQNLICNSEWILSGSGKSPYWRSVSRVQENYSDVFALEELIQMRRLHPNLEVMLLEDDAMAPCFRAGDYVGGVPEPLDESLYSDEAHIIKTTDNSKILRRIEFIGEKAITVRAINERQQTPMSISIDTIELVAPVFWHRLPSRTKE